MIERNGMGRRRGGGAGRGRRRGGKGGSGRETRGGRRDAERRGESAAGKYVAYLLLVVRVGSVFSRAMVPSLRDVLRLVVNYVTATCCRKAAGE